MTATAISSTQIQLSWEAVDGATKYNVYSGGYNFGPITETSYTMGYLQVNTNYCFHVSAINEVGESELTEACATTLNAKPIAPELTATATGESTIELSWSHANRATSYNVYQGNDKIATVTETTYTVEGLEPETNYCFTVTAENEMGESEKTEVKCATTNEKAPTIVEIGTESGGTELYLPVYDYSAYSISQQIYTSNEIALGNGIIRSVSFKVGDKGSAVTRKYEVYLKNITASSFQENGYEYFELSSSDKVYDGDVTVGNKQEWFTINFTTPFEYTGENVVLCVYDKTGTSLSSNYHNFYKYAASGRSLYNSAYYAYDPTTLATSASGIAIAYVNLIRFGILPSEVVAPAVPSLSAVATSSSEISLTWNFVPGATSYNVYQGDNQIATDITETTFNVEGLDAETEYCFTVTAVNAVGESAKSNEACVTTESGAPAICLVEFVLGDSYGDGWSNNKLTVSYGGTSIDLTFVVASYSIKEYSKEYTLEIPTGSNVTVTYTPGTSFAYTEENSFTIRYQDGDEIHKKDAGSLTTSGYSYEFDVECTPTAPNAPELTATANSSSSISLLWDTVSKATSYNVYQGSTQITSGLTETSYIVEGLEAETEYCFTVTAVNEVGESEVSNEECVMTKGTDDPSSYASTFFYNFDDGSLEDFILIDDDEDGQNWETTKVYGKDDYIAISYSWKTDVGALRPDNYLITKNKYSITENSEVSFKVNSVANAPENYSVIIATNVYDINSFTSVYEGSCSSSTPTEISVKLNEHTGSDVYIGIRHYNSYNQYNLSINDFQLTANTAKSKASENRDKSNNSRSKFESTFQQGIGYLASYEKVTSATFIGKLNHEKSYTFPVAYNSDKDLANFHLLGNPFSFNMKWNKVSVSNLATGYAVVNEQGGYTYYTDGEIKVGDGFFVKAIAENPSISYNEEQRSNDIESLNINVVVNGNAGSDNVVINLADTDNEGFPKFKNFNEEIATIFVNENDKSYGVFNCDKDVNEIPLHFKSNEMGRYNISIEANGIFENITLVDLISGKETDMLVNDYSFTATSKEDINRFIVRFTVSDKQSAVNNFVYQSGKDLIINAKGTVQIVDVMGRIIYDNIEASENTRIDVSNFRTGTYIVRLVSETEVKTQKVVVY